MGCITNQYSADKSTGVAVMSVKVIRHNGLSFQPDEIVEIRITNEIDPLSVSLVESVADVTLKLPEEKAVFSKSSPFNIVEEFGQKKRFWSGIITSMDRQGKDKWKISLVDVVGYLEKFEFIGDVYNEKNVLDLVSEICSKAGVTASVYSSGMDADTVSGWIPYTNCREALSQVLFAAGWYMRTKSLSDIQFARIETRTPVQIPQNRTLSGTITKKQEETTGVELLVHDFFEGESSKTIIWRSAVRGEAFNVMVEHETPVLNYSYHPPNKKSTYEVLVENANFLELNFSCFSIEENAPMKMRVDWEEYVHATNLIGKYVDGAIFQKIYAIENKTMVTGENSQSVLDRCFEYYTNNAQATAKVVIGKHVAEDGTVTYDEDVKCGDIVTIPTDYLGEYTGRVIKEQYNLNGNIIIKEITVK